MKDAIEKAIEGDWRAKVVPNGIKMTSGNWQAIMVQSGGFAEAWLLDPLFWKALGKQQGWNFHCESCGWEKKTSDQHWYCEECERMEIFNIGWLHHWHDFIDHIADGGNIEDFFTGLLK